MQYTAPFRDLPLSAQVSGFGTAYRTPRRLPTSTLSIPQGPGGPVSHALPVAHDWEDFAQQLSRAIGAGNRQLVDLSGNPSWLHALAPRDKVTTHVLVVRLRGDMPGTTTPVCFFMDLSDEHFIVHTVDMPDRGRAPRTMPPLPFTRHVAIEHLSDVVVEAELEVVGLMTRS